MTEAFTHSGAWLLQQVATLPDTIVTKTVPAAHTWFEQVTSIASGVMTLTLLALSAALIPAAWNFRKSYKKISDLLDRVYGDINPIMRHASSIADNVDYITTTVRTDVAQINATIATANQRLHQAVQLTEERIAEFNALMAVVQGEAEQTFVSTAATVRGVRTGAASFRDDLRAELASDGHEFTDEEEVDGYDGDGIEDGITRPAGSRRPRTRHGL
ncbi:MAG: hypothetical protein JWO05_569 [Gemmatimonadetes bacterium]|nr:hypothetical protein [Gemmatimonadota bacterium]